MPRHPGAVVLEPDRAQRAERRATASRTFPPAPSGGSSPRRAPPRLVAALIHHTCGVLPVRRELLDGLEAVLPAGLFERTPFRRIALWLRADAAGAPGPGLCLLEDGWLELEVALPQRVRAARNPAERRARLEAALLGALAEVALRFGVPAARLRRARHRRLVTVPLRRRR